MNTKMRSTSLALESTWIRFPELPVEALQLCAGIGDLLGSIDPACMVDRLAFHLLDPPIRRLRSDWTGRSA